MDEIAIWALYIYCFDCLEIFLLINSLDVESVICELKSRLMKIDVGDLSYGKSGWQFKRLTKGIKYIEKMWLEDDVCSSG